MKTCKACGGPVKPKKYAFGSDDIESQFQDDSDEQARQDAVAQTQQQAQSDADVASPSTPDSAVSSGDYSGQQQAPVQPQQESSRAPADDESEDVAPAEAIPEQPKAQKSAQPQAPKKVIPQKPSIAKAIVSPQPAQQTQQAFDEEYLKAKQDLATNLINPKTYADLYASKDTLGRIGSLFGLLMSGFGSGLSHQPNLVMDMMNKEIDRDLDAQRINQGNRLNFLNSINQHNIAKSQIALQGTQQQEALANVGLINANKNLTNLNTAKMQMLLGGLGHIGQITDRLPPGPQKQIATQALQGTAQAVDQHVAQMNAQTAQQIENNWKTQNRTMSVLSPELAQYDSQRHMTGEQEPANRPITEADRSQMQAMKVLDDKSKDLISFIDQNRGTINPQKRAQAEQKVEEMKNFYNNSIAGGALTEGRLKWYDEQFAKNPTSIVADLLGSTAKLKEVASSNKMRLNSLRGSYSLPAVSDGGAAPQYKTVGGVTYKRGPKGEAIKVE